MPSLSEWINWVTLNYETLNEYKIHFYDVESIINRKRLNEKMTESPQKIQLSARELYEALVERGKALAKKEMWTHDFSGTVNERIVKMLCLYFSGDPKMTEYGIHPQKGIWLEGPRGCGKSVPMRLLSCNPSASFEGQLLNPVSNFRFVHTQSIQTLIDSGVSYEFYGRPDKSAQKRFFYKTSQEAVGWCIDDVGAERMGNYAINRVAEVLSYMERTQKGNYHLFHVTTNLTDEEFGQVYGGRLVSRKYEMFNVISFPKDAPDLRIHKVNTTHEVEL